MKTHILVTEADSDGAPKQRMILPIGAAVFTEKADGGAYVNIVDGSEDGWAVKIAEPFGAIVSAMADRIEDVTGGAA